MKMTKLVEIGGMWESWQESTLHSSEEAPGWNRCHPHAIFLIMRSAGSVVKIGMKIATHFSAYAPHERFIFLAGKNMAALSELLLKMVTYFHAGSHLKPWRVKMYMQMRAGRKEHKNQWMLFSLKLSYMNSFKKYYMGNLSCWLL